MPPVRPFCGNRATTFPILHVTLPKGHFLQRIFHINVAYDRNRSFADGSGQFFLPEAKPSLPETQEPT
jgi:hypothetical protein